MTDSEQRPGTIRKLLRSEIGLLGEHLLRLDADARARRFGHHVSDAFIDAYARKAADIGAVTYGYFIDGHVHAAAELKSPAHGQERTAEAAFSVERDYANRGIATSLMGRVIRSARNRGVQHLVLTCLVENAKMRAIAAKYGADLIIEQGSAIADISPKRADYLSFASEFFDDRLALVHAALDLQLRYHHAA
jgi:GNAT superfamily N-acetyltransferase